MGGSVGRAAWQDLIDRMVEQKRRLVEFADYEPEKERYKSHRRNPLGHVLRDNHLRTLPPLTTEGMLDMFNYSYLWISPTGPETPEQITDEFLDTAIAGMRTHAE
ncbi:hypothetical protein [Nocardia fusca]|uniref:hypothetical protein n=1 Tax=Nocardia fusca TaxID=941183 RepID=UPI0007A7466E|nr:hypothetical protein [Nocardia fusca]